MTFAQAQPNFLARLWAQLRSAASGKPLEEHEQRLMQLYWNRAELKKELAVQQTQREALAEKLRAQEAATRRVQEQMEQLHVYLGNPEAGSNALVYFQLRALWTLGSQRLNEFASELRRQQDERERRRHSAECEARRAQRLAAIEARLRESQATAADLQARIQELEQRRAKLNRWWGLMFWHHATRRELAHEATNLALRWNTIRAEIADYRDERAQIAEQPPPGFPGMSLEGRRAVNTAAIAFAEYLIDVLPHRGLASLAKDAMSVQVFDIQFGSREDCARLLALIKSGLQVLANNERELVELKGPTERLRSRVEYRSDADAIPVAESVRDPAIAAAAEAASPGSLERKAGKLNVLVDDIWGLNQLLSQ